jgi:cell division transport system permease protein
MAYAERMKRFRELIASDIPFARDDAHRLLPAMIACLVGFAALLLALAISLSGALTQQSQQAIGGIQVELPHSKARDTAFIESVRAVLTRTAGVTKVELLSDAQMEALLAPWLGEGFVLADLPIPVMLDVTTEVKDGMTSVDVQALRATLAKIDSAIRVEDRGPWVAHMVRAISLLQGIVVLVALLLVACVIGMIVLVSRTNLRLHFKTVSLLHMFGATDEYILRQFQWNNAWLAARGAGVGMLVAGAVFASAVLLSIRWQSPVVPEISVTLLHVVLLLSLPVLTASIALFATRLTVRSMLEHMR